MELASYVVHFFYNKWWSMRFTLLIQTYYIHNCTHKHTHTEKSGSNLYINENDIFNKEIGTRFEVISNLVIDFLWCHIKLI